VVFDGTFLEGEIVPGHNAEGVIVSVQIAGVTDDGFGGLGQGGRRIGIIIGAEGDAIIGSVGDLVSNDNRSCP
jgi:hypothetical protein